MKEKQQVSAEEPLQAIKGSLRPPTAQRRDKEREINRSTRKVQNRFVLCAVGIFQLTTGGLSGFMNVTIG